MYEREVTGIDYLRLLDDAHGHQLQGQINYAALLQDGDAPAHQPADERPEQEPTP